MTHDGKVSPFGRPDDPLASTARYLMSRGKYRRGEHWGYEVRAGGRGSDETSRSYEAWQAMGVTLPTLPRQAQPMSAQQGQVEIKT